MTGFVRVEVAPAQVEAVPGSSVRVAVRIVNNTNVVDEFAIEVRACRSLWPAGRA